MDQIIAIVALVAFYVLQALAAKRKKQAQSLDPDLSADPAEVPPETSGEMADALAEIREALGMPGPPQPTRDPAAPAGPNVKSAPPASGPVLKPAAGPHRQMPATVQAQRAGTPTATSDTFHRVNTGRPDFEDAFERSGSEWTTSETFRSAGSTFPVKTSAASRAKTSLARPKLAPMASNRLRPGKSEFRDPLRDHDHTDPGPILSGVDPQTKARRYPSKDSLRRAIADSIILGPPRAYKRHGR